VDLEPVLMVLLDIRGYMRFTSYYRIRVLHAENIIDELLESVIGAFSHLLVVQEPLGDAISFYMAAPGTADIATEIRRQVAASTRAFREREAALISGRSLCTCQACVTVGKLRLKAILNYGQGVFSTVGGFQKLAGEDVIFARRLVKNKVPSHEYVPETETCCRLAGDAPHRSPEVRSEHPEGLGPVQIRVFYPIGQDKQLPQASMSKSRKIWGHVKIELYMVARLVGQLGKTFRNLDTS